MFTEEILEKYHVKRYEFKRRHVLFREEEPAHFLFYLLEGEVRIHNNDSEGKEFLIETVTDHQYLGEPRFLLRERYPATAVVMSETARCFCFFGCFAVNKWLLCKA